MTWNADEICRALSRQTFQSKCVLLVDRCTWTGHECDVLGVTTDLRIIDIEVKISRADLKADAKKDKWWHSLTWAEKVAAGRNPQDREQWNNREPVLWPRNVWKHYYAMPDEIWKPELLDCLPSPMSGVLLLTKKEGRPLRVDCQRRATPCRDATRLTAAQVMDIARLANLRMWDAYQEAVQARNDAQYWREQTKEASNA